MRGGLSPATHPGHHPGACCDVSFEPRSERVWPGLVITPETIVQGVKLLRSATPSHIAYPKRCPQMHVLKIRELLNSRAQTRNRGDAGVEPVPSYLIHLSFQ